MKSKFQNQVIEARRAQILEAAIAVIAEQGFQHTSIKQIAARAEVADGTIYNYFKNKDDILTAIIAHITEAETRELHFAEAEQVSFADFMHEYVAHRLTELNESYPVLKVVLTETLANPALGRQVYDQVYAPGFAVADRYLQPLVADGSLPNVDAALLSRLLAAPLLGLLLLRMLGDEHVAQHWHAYGEVLGEQMTKMFNPPAVAAAVPAGDGQQTPGKKRKKKEKKS